MSNYQTVMTKGLENKDVQMVSGPQQIASAFNTTTFSNSGFSGRISATPQRPGSTLFQPMSGRSMTPNPSTMAPLANPSSSSIGFSSALLSSSQQHSQQTSPNRTYYSINGTAGSAFSQPQAQQSFSGAPTSNFSQSNSTTGAGAGGSSFLNALAAAAGRGLSTPSNSTNAGFAPASVQSPFGSNIYQQQQNAGAPFAAGGGAKDASMRLDNDIFSSQQQQQGVKSMPNFGSLLDGSGFFGGGSGGNVTSSASPSLAARFPTTSVASGASLIGGGQMAAFQNLFGLPQTPQQQTGFGGIGTSLKSTTDPPLVLSDTDFPSLTQRSVSAAQAAGALGVGASVMGMPPAQPSQQPNSTASLYGAIGGGSISGGLSSTSAAVGGATSLGAPGSGALMNSGASSNSAAAVASMNNLNALLQQQQQQQQFSNMFRPQISNTFANLMARQSEAPSEFQINNDEFPALQGTQSSSETRPQPLPASGVGEMKETRVQQPERVMQQPPPPPAPAQQPMTQQPQQQQLQGRSGIQTSVEGLVTNIPPGMINDQFGMVGLLTMLRALEVEPTIVSLALGQDLTNLGLNLNAPDKNLHQTFGGPWADSPCRVQDMDIATPPEYQVNASIREKLSPIRLNRHSEELLFFLFYYSTGDLYQLAAAAELYSRDWRFHKEDCVWVSRAPGAAVAQLNPKAERGTYCVWDVPSWRKVLKEMLLEYEKLEEKPLIPQQTQQAQAHTANAVHAATGGATGGSAFGSFL